VVVNGRPREGSAGWPEKGGVRLPYSLRTCGSGLKEPFQNGRGRYFRYCVGTEKKGGLQVHYFEQDM
jgi:hypothetical protein